MTLDILRDRRLRSVEWRDLLPLRAADVVAELLLPLPWLALSLRWPTTGSTSRRCSSRSSSS